MATLARFDTTHASFDDATAWSSILVPGVPTNALFQGATFDGRWLYLVPSGPATPAVRFDTKAALTDMTAWTEFSLSFIPQLDSLMTGIFDNRYVYFLPRGFTTPTIVRYDTHAPFAAAPSWTSYAVGR